MNQNTDTTPTSLGASDGTPLIDESNAVQPAPLMEPASPALTIAVLGEILFSGSEVIGALMAAGFNVRVLCPNLAATAAVECAARSYQKENTVSLLLISGSMESESAISETLSGAFAAIYLSPITLEGRGDRPRTHLEDCKRLIVAAESSTLRKLIYHSALGANPKAASRTLRESAEAERLFQNCRCEDFFLRTGPLMGTGDHFLEAYAQSAKSTSPLMTILGYGSTAIHPLHVKDLATCIVRVLKKSPTELAPGAYSLAGPEATTVLDLYDLALSKAGRFKFKFHIPLFILKLLTTFQKGSAFEERVNLLFDIFYTDTNNITQFIDSKYPLKTIQQTQAELGGAQ